MGVIMISREEKNKKYFDEINREKAINITKKILKILAVIILIFTIIFLYSYFYETNKLETKEYLIKDINIPEEYNGSKILHLTDLLYGKTIDKGQRIKVKFIRCKKFPDGNEQSF